ncbi:MAG TPA: hypothetical protein VGL17_03395 [Gemmatimonadaceae bacterium]|jgi:hypothetical protein
MSLALKIPETAPSHQPYKLSVRELRLRDQFVAAFNDTALPGWQLHVAVWELTDDLKEMGELPEGVVKRIKYIAAIPISFHYRVGYKSGHARLKAAARQAVSLSIEHYFNESQEPREADSPLAVSRDSDRGGA